MHEYRGKVSFYCPFCGEKLSFLGGTVIKMVGRLYAPAFSCVTMFYFPAELGHYGAIVGEGVTVQEGAKVEFECINGACKKNFTIPGDDSLAEIKMVDERGKEYAVVFNKIYGKRSTYLIDIKEKKLVESYGEDAHTYSDEIESRTNYFGA